jgi:hypothetical protein
LGAQKDKEDNEDEQRIAKQSNETKDDEQF